MIQLYKNEWRKFTSLYARMFAWSLGIGLLISFLSYFSLVNQPEQALQTMKQLTEQLLQQAENFGADVEGSNTELFWFILKNNLYVSMIIFLIGFIPLVILPLLLSVVTFLSIGVMLAGIEVLGENAMKALFTSILPHGIIEILGLVLVTSMSMYMSLQIAKKLFSVKRDEIVLTKTVWNALRSYIVVAVPMIVIAAIIEGFITPKIMGIFY